VTTIAAPPRRARASTRTATTRAPARTRRTTEPARARARTTARPSARAATRPIAIGKIGVLLAVVTVLALVTAVVFHVFLAQNQMQLDHLNAQIDKAQETYEKRHLTVALLGSPQHVIQEAERQGLVMPPAPPTWLSVPDAPLPKTSDGTTSETIADWSKTKPSLAEQP
jgi:cell division protein FtsL